MISLFNALKVSKNKLKYKKVLVAITIFISAISVSFILFFITVSNGFLKSINNYTKQSLKNEYLVKITPNVPSNISWLPRYELDNNLVEEIKAFEKKYQDEESILLSDDNDIEKTPTGFIVNYESPHYYKYIEHQKEEYAKTATNTLSSLKNNKEALSISNIYTYYQAPFGRDNLHFIGVDKTKENLQELESDDQLVYGTFDHDARRSNYTFIDDKIIENFLSKDITYENDAIPVLTTKEENSTLFGTQNAEGKTYYSCYRKNATKIEKCENYVKFQVVGIIPLQTQAKNTLENLEELFKDTINTKFYSGAIIPIKMFKQSESFKKYGSFFYEEYVNTDIFIKHGINTHIISFNNIESARDFIENKACKIYSENCNKNWYAEVFGLNYLLISDIAEKIKTITIIITIISSIIVCLMILLATTKMIMESQKESAVFRAIGARKTDILKIYLSYTFIVATRTLIISAFIALIAVFAINSIIPINIENLLAQSGFKNYSFSLLSFEPIPILCVIFGIYIISFAATIPTSIVNIHKNIIKNIKDE